MVPYLSRALVCRWYTGLLVALTVGGLLHFAPAAAGELPAVIATVNEQPITAEELNASLRSELLRLEMQRYEVMKQKLDDLIASRLMALEAAKRQISVPQLEQEEITAQVATVTPEQVKAFYEENRNRISQPFEAIAPRIEAYLAQQAQQQRRQTFLRELRQHYRITVALTPPTVDVDADDDPFLGPADAAVTIIEFSDFQCPFCRRIQPTLKRLLQEYDGKVRLVFRDFPLRSIHQQAQKAAEAAQCAADQQQFWPYHDKLFAVTNLEVEHLKQYAKELGLDEQQFNTCLETGKYAREVEKDLQDGQQAGVSATPSFFINGQPLSGAVPYERFKEMVDAALEQRQAAKRSTP